MNKKVTHILMGIVLALAFSVSILLGTEINAKAANVIANGTVDKSTDVTWTIYDTGELVFEGQGIITDCSSSVAGPWRNYNDSVTSITVGEGIQTIEQYAFYKMSNCKTVEVKGNLTAIGGSAFSGMTSLETVTFKGDTGDIGSHAFGGCKSLTEIVVEGNVGDILSRAFSECDSFTTVTVGGNVGNIGEDMFWGSDTLKSFSVTGTIGNIGKQAFRECDALEDVTSAGVGEIGERAFYKSVKFKGVTFSDRTTSIGYQAFYYCDGIEEIVLPITLTTLGKESFSGCDGLKKVTILNPELDIPSNAFQYSSKIEEVNVENKEEYLSLFYGPWKNYIGSCGDNLYWRIEDGILRIYSKVEGGTYTMTSAPKTTDEVKATVKEIIVEEGVTNLYTSSFSGFINAEEVTIPTTLTDIGSYAFRNTGISKIVIPESVLSIGDYAFAGTKKLTELIVPENVTTLGSYFIQYSDIKSLTLKGEVEYSYRTLDGCSTLENLVVEKGVIPVLFASDSSQSLKYLELGSGVDAVESYAFLGFVALESVVCETGDLRTIGESAFEGCSSLNHLALGDGIETIGKYAFFACPNLHEVRIDSSVTSIGNWAFHGMYDLSDEGKEPGRVVCPDPFYMYGYFDTEAERYASVEQYCVNFDPLEGDISKLTMKLSKTSYTYDGTEKKPTITIVGPRGVKLNSLYYTEPVYTNNINAGTATVKVTANAPLTGTLSANFTIKDNTDSGDSGSSRPGEDLGIEGAIISEEEKMVILEWYEPYFREYGAVGSVGAEEVAFLLEMFKEVNPAFTNADVYVVLEDFGIEYEAEASKPCEHKWDAGKVTKPATCKETGVKTYTCTVCGTATKTETIAQAAHTYGSWVKSASATSTKDGSKYRTCSKCGDKNTTAIYKASSVALSATAYTYNGKTKTPSVDVKDSKGTKLKEGTDYTVKYASGRKNVGKYKVTITFKGNYSGSVVKYFKVNPKGASVSKATAAKKAFTVKWKKPSSTYRKQMTGYQVRYSTSSKMSKAKTVTVKSTTSTSKKISKLKAKKTYYVQIRTYKKVGSTTYYSGWSKAKKVKTK